MTNFMDESLIEFIKTFGASLDDRTWITLVKEELEELKAETPGTKEHLKEFIDLSYVFVGLGLVAGASLDLLPDDEAKEFEGLITEVPKVLSRGNVWYNDNILTEAFHRVHQSNMSKLGDDGKPIRREDGKVLKGPNYQPPNLEELVL